MYMCVTILEYNNTERILLAVTNPVTFNSLNLSIVLRYLKLREEQLSL